MKKLIPICVLVAGIGGTATAQNGHTINPGEKILGEAKVMFNARNWTGCTDKISLLKQSGTAAGMVDLLEEADYMLTVSRFELGNEDALDYLLEFKYKYPNSSYSTIIEFLTGSFYFFNGSYADAAATLDEVDMVQLPLINQPAYLNRLGISNIKRGNTTEARPCFIALKSFNSEYSESSDYYLAYIDYLNGDYDKALKEFEALPANEEFSFSVPYYIAQIKFIKKEYGTALSSAESLLKNNPDREQKTELLRIAGESSYHLNKKRDAVKYLTDYSNSTSRPYRATSYILGMAAYEAGEYKTAVDNFAVVTTGNDATTQNSYLHLGHCYVQTGDLKNARMAFEAAANSDFDKKVKEVAMYNYGLTIVQTSYSPFNESVQVFEVFLNEFPSSEYSDFVNDQLVEAYMTTRNYESALNSINKIKRPGSKILTAKQRVLFQLGTQCVVNSEGSKAKECFTNAISLGPLNNETLAQAYFWRAECYYKEDAFTQATSDYNRFLTISGRKNTEMYALGKYNLAYSYFKQHDFNNAITWFDSYLQTPTERGKATYIDALNRIGDSHFYKRSFAKAEGYYSQAASLSPNGGDYALFQKGFMAGLQKKYTQKIDAMDKLLKEYPDSDYADDALMERGKTYVTLGKKQEAIASFTKVASDYPTTTLARQACIQLGMIYFNMNELDKSVKAYKDVISKYPGSEEARIAVEDLKAVYIEKNDIPSYAEYVKSLNGVVQFAAGEQDSLTFLATEKVVIRGDKDNSKKALINYLQSFNDGAFRMNANIELARIYESEQDYTSAVTHYQYILQSADNKYTEEALSKCADIYYATQQMQEALDTYSTLAVKAEKTENRVKGKAGILRANVALNRHDDITVAATNLLKDDKITTELYSEALYCRAKAFLAKGNVEAAKPDLKDLSKDTRLNYGAEAKYLIAEELFKEGKDNDAEAVVFELIESATPHQYWLAKGFILLADIYIGKDDLFQARQYLSSLQTNYKANDEIGTLIDERFKVISEKEESKQLGE